MTSKSKDIIFLLGAGASAEAEIPPSGQMIDHIEELLTGKDHAEWSPYATLYNHIKSAIHYAAGLKGQFRDGVAYNIETLVNTLYELERNEEHPLYPFIASWNSRLVSLSRGDDGDFSKVRDFRRLILNQLKSWVSPDDISLADYFQGLIPLQRGLTFPLRIFSLNYDLCVERLNTLEFRVETGFEGIGPKFPWDWERFEDSNAGPTPPEIYLYKLHGSINWKRDATRNLICLEQTEGIAPEKMDLIFGRDLKLEAADPYLFYAYELRKYSLETRLIVCIGYGFGDQHINKILTQSLQRDETRRLLVVANCRADDAVGPKKTEVCSALSVRPEQVLVEKGSSKGFLKTTDLHMKLLGMIPKPPDAEF
ncbi:MAG: SIR2 family protein [Opitutaceae bacterium]